MNPRTHAPANPQQGRTLRFQSRRDLPADARATRELLRHVPQFSMAERNRRWNRLRRALAAQRVDNVLFLGSDIYFGMGHSNMRWVFQIDSHIGTRALFTIDQEPIVWSGLSHMNLPTSMLHSVQEWVHDVRDLEEGLPAMADAVRQRGGERGRIGIVTLSSALLPSTLLHIEHEGLRKLLPEAEFVDLNGLLADMRVIKSEEEIDMLRRAGGIARKVVDAMIDTARPGVPDAVVYAKMIETQIANGADPNIFNLFSAGPVEHPPDEIWHLLHGCDQPLMPTQRPLKPGDLIIAEFHTKFAGLRCHTEMTVYLGEKAPRQLLNIWEVSQECLQASREALVPGRSLREAIDMIRRPARRANLDWVELGFHAMGTASPEFPLIVLSDDNPNRGAAGARIGDILLEEGMTFGNNIDLHDSSWKPDVGCMLSDFMVVRPGKAECLVGVPERLPQVT